MLLTEFGDFYDVLEQDVSGNHISSVDVLSVARLFSLRSYNLQHKTCPTRGTKSSNQSQIESVLSHLRAMTLSSLQPQSALAEYKTNVRIKLANEWNTALIFKIFNGGIDQSEEAQVTMLKRGPSSLLLCFQFPEGGDTGSSRSGESSDDQGSGGFLRMLSVIAAW